MHTLLSLLVLASNPFHAELANARPIASVSSGVGVWDGVSAVLTTDVVPFVELEGSAGVGLFMSQWAVLGGARIPVLDTRTAEVTRGSKLDLVVLGGYRSVERVYFNRPTDEYAQVSVVTGLRYTYWFAQHFGLTARLTGGVALRNAAPLPDASLTLGVAF